MDSSSRTHDVIEAVDAMIASYLLPTGDRVLLRLPALCRRFQMDHPPSRGLRCDRDDRDVFRVAVENVTRWLQPQCMVCYYEFCRLLLLKLQLGCLAVRRSRDKIAFGTVHPLDGSNSVLCSHVVGQVTVIFGTLVGITIVIPP